MNNGVQHIIDITWKVTLSFFLIIVSGCNLFEKEFIFPSPVAKQAQQISSIGFVAQWKKVNGASSYEIDVARDQKFTQPVSNYQSIKVDSTAMAITNLDAGVDYYYQVRARISNQTSKNSNVIKVTTLSLNTPVTFSATEVTANSFRIHWELNNTATSYLLDIATDASFNNYWDNYKDRDVGLDTTWSVNNLKINQQYFYRIRVKQNNTLSEYSNIQSVFTSTLATPKLLPVTDVQLTSFKLNWKTVSEATSYQVDVAKDALFRDKLPEYNSKSATTNSATIVSLDANQTYYCRIRAVNNNIISNHSEVAQVQTQNLATPKALPASNIQIGAFKANWQSITNATVYLLEVALDQNFSNITANYDNVVGAEAVVSGLEANTQYFYRVRAQGVNTISNYSNVIQATTQSLAAPTTLAATNQTTAGFTIGWTSSAEATAYVLDIATDPNFTQFFAGYKNKEVTGNSLDIKNIDFRQDYYYRLRAKRLSSLSTYSNVTKAEACISKSCRITKLEIFAKGSTTPATYSQTYTYDTQNRLTVITQNTANDQKFLVTYNPDNTVKQVNYMIDGKLVRRYFYIYNGNELSVKSFWVNSAGQTGPQWEWIFTYDNKKRLVNRKHYDNHTRTNLRFEFKYLYNEKGQVNSVLSPDNLISRFYNYDDKISLYNLFHPGLAFFISTSTNDNVRAFFPVNNMVYEQIWRDQYNYTYTYNSKGIAMQQNGDYIIKFTLEGCNF